MKYDFETVRKRFHSGSDKWDEMLAWGVREEEDVIPFSVADMEFVTAPEIVEALKLELDRSILGYAAPTDSYREAVCGWLKKRHGWDARPEWILTTHGVVDAFCEAVQAYTQEGEGVLLLTPVYYPMYIAARNNHRALVDCPLIRTDKTGNGGGHEVNYQIDFDALERLAAKENTKLLILCSPHNPCGRVWTREELSWVGEICLRHHVLVVSDEIHCDLLMPGHRHTPWASLSPEMADHCVVCAAPSKTFNIAGLQTANVLIPNPTLRERFLRSLRHTNPNPECNILGYCAAEAAYRHCEGWLEEALMVIEGNRRMIVDFVNRELPQLGVTPLEGTYLLWLDCRALGLDDRELERVNRQEARLFFDEGYIFGAGGSGFVRWNLACPPRYIQSALERMKAAYGKYLR